MGRRDGWLIADYPIVRILVGHRHRQDMGDMAELMDSMNTLGQLQPITVTPEGVLICGGRRLEAAKRLGWGRVAVWVLDGMSEPLERLLAEQHENTMRKPFNTVEAAALYQELKAVLAEAAAAREQAARFGSDQRTALAESAIPREPEPRVQAAQLVTGRKSYTMLEQVSELRRVATNPRAPEALRKKAAKSLAGITKDGKVNRHYQSYKQFKHSWTSRRNWNCSARTR